MPKMVLHVHCDLVGGQCVGFQAQHCKHSAVMWLQVRSVVDC